MVDKVPKTLSFGSKSRGYVWSFLSGNNCNWHKKRVKDNLEKMANAILASHKSHCGKCNFTYEINFYILTWA